MYKQAFSDLSNAFNNVKFANELTPLTDYNDYSACKANLVSIGNNFSKTKECEGSELSQCWEMSGEKFRSGTPISNSDAYSFIDSKGRSWSYRNIVTCYIVLVDTNGNKAPNLYGKDRFPFLLAYQPHLDDPDVGWGANYGSISGVPLKVHPFEDQVQYTGAAGSGYTCGSVENCYYKSWLK